MAGASARVGRAVKVEELRQFNPMLMLPNDGHSVLVYGNKRAGKTTAVQWMLLNMYERYNDHIVILFAQTGNANREQWKIIPKEWMVTDISNLGEILTKIFTRQERAIKEEKAREKDEEAAGQASKKKRRRKLRGDNRLNEPPEEPDAKRPKNGGTRAAEAAMESFADESKRSLLEMTLELSSHNRAPERAMHKLADGEIEFGEGPQVPLDRATKLLLIFDDCGGHNAIKYEESIRTLANSQRHFKITMWFMFQSVLGSNSCPPALRNNVDAVVMCGHFDDLASREFFADTYMTRENYKNVKQLGMDLMTAVCTDVHYRCLVILRGWETGIAMNRFCYTWGPTPAADELPEDFKLGLDEQWLLEETDGAGTDVVNGRAWVPGMVLDARNMRYSVNPNFMARYRQHREKMRPLAVTAEDNWRLTIYQNRQKAFGGQLPWRLQVSPQNMTGRQIGSRLR